MSTESSLKVIISEINIDRSVLRMHWFFNQISMIIGGHIKQLIYGISKHINYQLPKCFVSRNDHLATIAWSTNFSLISHSVYDNKKFCRWQHNIQKTVLKQTLVVWDYVLHTCMCIRTNDNFQVGRCVIIAHLICAGVLMLQRP